MADLEWRGGMDRGARKEARRARTNTTPFLYAFLYFSAHILLLLMMLPLLLHVNVSAYGNHRPYRLYCWALDAFLRRLFSKNPQPTEIYNALPSPYVLHLLANGPNPQLGGWPFEHDRSRGKRETDPSD